MTPGDLNTAKWKPSHRCFPRGEERGARGFVVMIAGHPPSRAEPEAPEQPRAPLVTNSCPSPGTGRSEALGKQAVGDDEVVEVEHAVGVVGGGGHLGAPVPRGQEGLGSDVQGVVAAGAAAQGVAQYGGAG